MKPSLQLSIGQHLTLTPQLQQAIRLLQLSTIDLQQEIQLIVESNPMLEATPNEDKADLDSPEAPHKILMSLTISNGQNCTKVQVSELLKIMIIILITYIALQQTYKTISGGNWNSLP